MVRASENKGDNLGCVTNVWTMIVITSKLILATEYEWPNYEIVKGCLLMLSSKQGMKTCHSMRSQLKQCMGVKYNKVSEAVYGVREIPSHLRAFSVWK